MLTRCVLRSTINYRSAASAAAAAIGMTADRTTAVTMRRRGTRSFVSASLPLYEKKVIAVPTMGDSITEGTIVEWTANIGQAVKTDDIVALIETDKVTVEIKAQMDGVITQHFGALDETVEVGANLYEIDTEAEATYEASSSLEEPRSEQRATTPPPAAEITSKSDSPSTGEISSTETGHRVPSIQFLGKKGWTEVLSGAKQPTPDSVDTKPSSPPAPSKPHGTISITDNTIPPSFGRPKVTESEMEALIYGGANLDPNYFSVEDRKSVV